MKLNYAIICDNAFTDKDGRVNIVQTFEEIYASKFPAIHPRLTFITSYELNENERNKEYIQTTKIVSSEDNEIIARGQVKNSPKEESKKMQFIYYFVGLKFDKAGIYKIKYAVNGQEEKTVELIVKNPPN